MADLTAGRTQADRHGNGYQPHRGSGKLLLPDNCRKVSMRAWLLFLEQKGWLDFAAAIERAALANGRRFSQLRFPPD